MIRWHHTSYITPVTTISMTTDVPDTKGSVLLVFSLTSSSLLMTIIIIPQTIILQSVER